MWKYKIVQGEPLWGLFKISWPILSIIKPGMGLHFEKFFLANESFFGAPQQNPQRKGGKKKSVCIYKASSLEEYILWEEASKGKYYSQNDTLLFHRKKLFLIMKPNSDGSSAKEPTCQCRRHKRHGFDPWVRKIPWRRAWQPRTTYLCIYIVSKYLSAN